MKYAFTQVSFAELRPELEFYTGLHWDKVEILTTADKILDSPHVSLSEKPYFTDTGNYKKVEADSVVPSQKLMAAPSRQGDGE